MNAKTVYRPTSFTALCLIYNIESLKIALMIFVNGNATLSGFKNSEASRIFAQEIYLRILIVKLFSPIAIILKEVLLLINFIVGINVFYNTKKNFGICTDRE